MQYLTQELIAQYLPLIFDVTPDEREGMLPHVDVQQQEGGQVALFCFSHPRKGIEQFILEMLSKHLMPLVRCQIDRYYTSRCKLFELESQEYFLCHALVTLPAVHSQETFLEHVPLFLREMKLGMRSPYHERKILEMRALSIEEKHVFIQERTSQILEKFPEIFDYDLYACVQRFLLTTSDSFRKERSSKHLMRVILSIYAMMQRIERESEHTPHRRHLYCRQIYATIEQPMRNQRVVGFVLGVHFLKENEIFEKRHLINILQKTIPCVAFVPDTYYGQKNERGNVLVAYLEIERQAEWQVRDFREMQQDILMHLRVGIEQLVRPLFMPRNEEEIMKYTVTLAQEIQNVDDIPQVVILFQEQTDSSLFFTVVLVRPHFAELASVEDTIALQEVPALDIYVEKTKEVGKLQPNVGKESVLLRVRLSNAPFLREDGAVDLYKARHKVVSVLEVLFGDIRDFNGGMIAKQTESLELLKTEEDNQFLLENFFYSIGPSELRSILRTDILRQFYQLFVHMIEQDEQLVTHEDHEVLMRLVKLSQIATRNQIQETIKKMDIPYPHLVYAQLPIGENHYLGYILFSEDREYRNTIKNVTNVRDYEEADYDRAFPDRG